MELTTSNFVSVRFKNGTTYFFGSLAAMFVAFSPEQLGITLPELYAQRLTLGKTMRTPTCSITKHMLYRKPHKAND